MKITTVYKRVGVSMKAKQTFFILLSLVIFSNTSLAINFTPTSVRNIAQAYGFILGQEYSLSLIENKFPELSDHVQFARTQFNAIFPDIRAKLETQLKNAMDQRTFQVTTTTLQNKIKENLDHQQLTKEIAINFLDQVANRSKGEVESPVLKYLLAVKYATNPAGEFFDGFRQHYQTDGTGKSQGIKLNLQLPRSWAAEEGERPHIVKKWVSTDGTGLETILLDIRDAHGHTPANREVDEYARSGKAKETVPDGATYIASGGFHIEGRAGYWVQMSMPIERAGIQLYQDILMYQFFFNGKAIGLMCQAGGERSERIQINNAFERLKPLCQQVLNSLILVQAY